MQAQQLQAKPHQTYVLVFDKDDEFMTAFKAFVREKELAGSHFTAVGAFSQVTLGFFDRQTMDYKEIPVDEQVEVLSLMGNVADNEGQPKIHAHAVVGKADGSTLGGHILAATVWPTLELVIEESPRQLWRHTDPETGLALLQLNFEQNKE